MSVKQKIYRFVGIITLLSVLSAHLSVYAFHVPVKENSKTEKTVLKQLNQEIVVPSFQFDFGVCPYVFVDLSTSLFDFNPANNSVLVFPIISYFEKLFEHHIAINAP